MKTSEIKETEETERDVPRITVRHKDETKEEKKQRKQEVKSERKVSSVHVNCKRKWMLSIKFAWVKKWTIFGGNRDTKISLDVSEVKDVFLHSQTLHALSQCCEQITLGFEPIWNGKMVWMNQYLFFPVFCYYYLFVCLCFRWGEWKRKRTR